MLQFCLLAISMDLGEVIQNFLRSLHKCNTSMLNGETRLCEYFLQQLSRELNTLLCSTTLLFFTAFVW